MTDEIPVEEPKQEEPKKEDNKYTKMAVQISICVGVIFFLCIILFSASLFPKESSNMTVQEFYKIPTHGPGSYDLNLTKLVKKEIADWRSTPNLTQSPAIMCNTICEQMNETLAKTCMMECRNEARNITR